MKNLIRNIPDSEDERTLELFRQFKSLNMQAFLTKKQLLDILKWKSPRPLRFYIENSEQSVKEITSLAFATKNENLKIHILTALTGVNYPAASAILMFYDRSKFPVLDIRVWQQLHKAKLVDTNSRGQNFSLQQWEKYLSVIRMLAEDLHLSARQVEKRIFDYDRKTRKDNLY
jgi:thermostable 8-oxoguanine DNA glycosylase